MTCEGGTLPPISKLFSHLVLGVEFYLICKFEINFLFNLYFFFRIENLLPCSKWLNLSFCSIKLLNLFFSFLFNSPTL